MRTTGSGRREVGATESIYIRVPVRRGHTDEMVEILKLLTGPLEAQNLEKARELGVIEEEWRLERSFENDVLFVRLDSRDGSDVIGAFESSSTPIAIWLRSKLKTHTCYDPTRIEQVMEPPAESELIAHWTPSA